MTRTGLVSVTFRQLSAEEIIGHVQRASLEGIEWGGDIHVPHGDVARAKEVQRRTCDAGLQIAAYGSYYRVAASEGEGLSFASVLESAVALEAPLIRVWPGDRGSADVDEAFRNKVVEDALRIAAMAAEEDITIAYEWHVNTLTDTFDSAMTLLQEASHPRLRTLWQPTSGVSHDDCLTELSRIHDRLDNIHVTHTPNGERKPLSDGIAPWRDFLRAANTNDKTRYALLEFVCDDSPDAFREDAKTLKEIVSSL
jgi:3-dehydroshikimate dehydratase